MPEPISTSLDDLIDEITMWPVGMPVRLMERVLAAGETAVTALSEALIRWRNDEERDTLWLVVLLGELRSPIAVLPLIHQLCRTNESIVAPAAGEALAKIGPSAVPALLEVVRTGNDPQRLYAYSTLGSIPDDRAYTCLVDGLVEDRDMGDILAMALAEQGRVEAIPVLYEAYQRCESWQRIEFESAIRELHYRQRPAYVASDDWRLRYRRIPQFGGAIMLGWATVAALAHQDHELRQRRAALPLRSLERITAEHREPEPPAEFCEECGALIEQPTGLPVCPETALAAALHQVSLLNEARDDGIENLFDLLDDLEDCQWERREQREPVTPAARRRWRDEGDELQVCHQTCRWLIEQGPKWWGPLRPSSWLTLGRLSIVTVIRKASSPRRLRLSGANRRSGGTIPAHAALAANISTAACRSFNDNQTGYPNGASPRGLMNPGPEGHRQDQLIESRIRHTNGKDLGSVRGEPVEPQAGVYKTGSYVR